MKRSMRGMTMVEFAIVAAALFMIIFASIEFGRASFTLAALNEGTRRGARLAAVCPLNDPGSTSRPFPGSQAPMLRSAILMRVVIRWAPVRRSSASITFALP